MMAGLVEFLSWTCFLTGGFFVLVGAIGLLRLPDFYARLHAAGLCDTVGTGLVLAGLMLHSGLNLVTVKLLLILYFVIFTGPTATHALAEAAVHGKLKPLTEGREKNRSNTS